MSSRAQIGSGGHSSGSRRSDLQFEPLLLYARDVVSKLTELIPSWAAVRRTNLLILGTLCLRYSHMKKRSSRQPWVDVQNAECHVNPPHPAPMVLMYVTREGELTNATVLAWATATFCRRRLMSLRLQ